jgi:hypothetical protein
MFQEFREAEELSTAFLTDVSLLPTKTLYCRFIDPWVHWSTCDRRQKAKKSAPKRLWGDPLRRTPIHNRTHRSSLTVFLQA